MTAPVAAPTAAPATALPATVWLAVGLLFGTLAGSAAAQGAWLSTQQQFDTAYYVCMYATGHRVPVPAYDVARYRAWYESLTPPASTAAPADMPPLSERTPAPPSPR